MKRQIAPLFVLIVSGCAVEAPPVDDSAKLALAAAIANACPISAPNDKTAREQCADALTDMGGLREALADPMLWGGHGDKPLETAIKDSHLTSFNPRVWRRMYLSTFMFTGEAYVTENGNYRVLHMPVQFRNMLDPGEYPYPFWHSEKKWRAYEVALEVLFFYEGDKIVGAVRSSLKDDARSHVVRTWDGAWTWDNGAQPANTLYSSMFSVSNPHIERLEIAYRALEDGMRSQNCASCHDPSNSTMMPQLELLNYPNQALSGRHDVVAQLEGNTMPPGVGVADQVVRLDLIRLARDFAAAGDDALKFDGETIAAHQ